MMTVPFASGTLFSRIFHASPVGMTINNIADGVYLDVNESFARLVGYEREELIGHRAVDLGIITVERRQPMVDNLVARHRLVHAPLQLRHRSGDVREVVVSAQMEEFGAHTYGIAIIQDLTEYLRAQSALNASEARFRLFFQSVPLPVIVYDMTTRRILDANLAAAEAFGYGLEELHDLDVGALAAGGDVEALQAALLTADVTGQADGPLAETAPAGVLRLCRRDGAPLDAAVAGYSFQLEGRPVRLAVLRDVTEQLAAERALVESERRLRIITELSTDGIWEWDVPNRDFQLNDVFERLYGRPDPTQVEAWWSQVIHPDDAAIFDSLTGIVFESAQTFWSTEVRVRRADLGQFATVLARGYVMRDPKGLPMRMVGALVDITRQMDVAEAAARAALAERQRLARDLHDSVTQSLYSVTLLAEVARRRARAGDTAAVLEHINRLGELAQQCLREMRLLVYELRPALVEEAGLVGALRQRLEAVEQRSGVRVQLQAGGAADIPLPVQNELFRVAEEALNNALKHARASSLTVRLDSGPDAVALEIADNGRGFDPVQAARSGGQGLGNMRERVARLGGEFAIESAPGEQTCVRVRVALSKPPYAPVHGSAL